MGYPLLDGGTSRRHQRVPHPKGNPNQIELSDPGLKRRARDSNPQPLAGYLSSSEAAHQFAYPPTWAPFLSEGAKVAMRTSLTAIDQNQNKDSRSAHSVQSLKRVLRTTDQLNEFCIGLKAAELLR